MTRSAPLLTRRRLTVLRITHPNLNAALERHPELEAAFLGRLSAPDSAQDADVTWRPRHGEGDPHA